MGREERDKKKRNQRLAEAQDRVRSSKDQHKALRESEKQMQINLSDQCNRWDEEVSRLWRSFNNQYGSKWPKGAVEAFKEAIIARLQVAIDANPPPKSSGCGCVLLLAMLVPLTSLATIVTILLTRG